MGIDAGVIRLKPSGVPQELAERISIPLVNAGTATTNILPRRSWICTR